MSGTRIDDVGIAALAETVWPLLRRLDLSGVEIGDAGAVALANASTLPQLTRVSLYHTPLSPTARTILADRFGAGLMTL